MFLIHNHPLLCIPSSLRAFFITSCFSPHTTGLNHLSLILLSSYVLHSTSVSSHVFISSISLKSIHTIHPSILISVLLSILSPFRSKHHASIQVSLQSCQSYVLQLYKSTADYKSGKALYDRYTNVCENMLSLRDIVLKRKQPRKMFVQCHTVIKGLSTQQHFCITFTLPCFIGDPGHCPLYSCLCNSIFV